MTAAELLAARTLLGFTPDQFAAELGVPPHVYAAWERGTVPISKRYAEEIAFHAAAAERAAALTASGLPECDWVRRWEEAPQPAKADAQVARLEELVAHCDGCETCRARDRFIAERFGPMPARPVPGWVRTINRVRDAIDRLPRWARPAAWGALILGALTLVRVVLLLPRTIDQPSQLGVALGALAAAIGAGAVGGLVYSFVGRPLLRVPVAGPYLAGIVTTMGYMFALPLGSALTGDPMIENAGELGAFVLVAAVLGIVLGFAMFRRRERPAPTG